MSAHAGALGRRAASARRRRGRSPIAPEPEQERQKREAELVDQRKRIRDHEIEHGEDREDDEQRREAEIQAPEETRQDRHAPSI